MTADSTLAVSAKHQFASEYSLTTHGLESASDQRLARRTASTEFDKMNMMFAGQSIIFILQIPSKHRMTYS